MKQANYIKLEQCKKGHLYKINSRNLRLGVYDGCGGFIGIRTKFLNRYLFTEYHYDQGAPNGTVFPVEEIEPIPSDIQLIEYFDTIDSKTGRKVAFDRPVKDGGKGWYYLDTGEPSYQIDPTSPMNQPLFDYLIAHETRSINPVD